MGMASPIYYTAEQVRALPEDGNRYEVVHGEFLVTPAPRLLHQEVVSRLLVVLSRYLEAEPVGHPLLAPADISWGRRGPALPHEVIGRGRRRGPLSP